MGGRVNEHGEVEWELHVPLEEQVSFYESKPPASFDNLRLTAIPLPDHPFDGHGEPVNSAFKVACTCGSASFIAMAHEGEDGWSEDPVSLKCATCGTERVVFDGRRHGYDGAHGHNQGARIPKTDRIALIGNDIGPPPYRVLVRFEYLSDILGGEEFSDWKGRESELYSWFTLVAAPMTGEAAETIFDMECA